METRIERQADVAIRDHRLWSDFVMPAELIILNGRVFRGSAPHEAPPHGSDIGPSPSGAPTSVAVQQGRVVWLGDDSSARSAWIGERTEVLDAGGGLVLAGFEDAHTHPIIGAAALDGVELSDLRTLDALLERIRRFAELAPTREWIVGRGWFHEAFPEALPTKEQLDTAVLDRPAFMANYGHHSGWVNTNALERAGIGMDTPDPPNGIIVRGPDGMPTGLLRDEAMNLVSSLIPGPRRSELRSLVQRAFDAMHAVGLTAVQDAEWLETSNLGIYREMLEAGELSMRVRLAFPMRPEQTFGEWQQQLDEFGEMGFNLRGDRMLSTGILKGYADGVIEGKTAALLAPYEGQASSGIPFFDEDQLNAFTAEADQRGWQVEMHAIGDRGVRMSLDAYAQFPHSNWTGDPEGAGAPAGTYARRHRVEHVELVDPVDIQRFAQLGVLASMQPQVLRLADPSDPTSIWALNLGPSRSRTGWPWGSIQRTGGRVALGSDWPVSPFDPLLGLHAVVTRQAPPGASPPAEAAERLSLPQALSGYTLEPAHAAYAESHRGTIDVGNDADIVILDRDLLEDGPSAIPETHVRATVAGGRIVYRAG